MIHVHLPIALPNGCARYLPNQTDVRLWGCGHGADALECLLLHQSGHERLRIAAVQTDP